MTFKLGSLLTSSNLMNLAKIMKSAVKTPLDIKSLFGLGKPGKKTRSTPQPSQTTSGPQPSKTSAALPPSQTTDANYYGDYDYGDETAAGIANHYGNYGDGPTTGITNHYVDYGDGASAIPPPSETTFGPPPSQATSAPSETTSAPAPTQTTWNSGPWF